MFLYLRGSEKKEEHYVLSKLRERFFGSEKAPLNEEYGAYDTDYTDANILTDLIFEMLKNDEKNKVFNNLNFKDIQKNNTVKISLVFDYGKTNASIETEIENNSIVLYIIVTINPNYKLFGQDDFIRKELVTIISHELSHVYSEKVKYTDKQLVQSIPKWYEVVCKICQETEMLDNTFIFAYGLYLSWYEEIQAFSNQVFYDVGYNGETKEDILKDFYKSDAYQNYAFIKRNLQKLKNLSEEEKNSIINKMQKNGLNEININNFGRYIKQIEYGNEKGIEKLNRALNLVFKKKGLI